MSSLTEPVEIRFLMAELQTLTVRPGDRFVLHSDLRITDAARIFEAWRKFAGEDVPLLVIDSGMRLGVIRAEDAVTLRLDAANHART